MNVDDIDVDGASDASAPVWAVFGDLMSGLLGAFVLILLFALASQLELVTRLQDEIRQHQLEQQRRAALERALAVPLAAGRVTIDHGRIDINGSVLFAFNSAELQPEGLALLRQLAGPITTYLKARDEILMVSGFTDDRQVRGGNHQFADNWELSAQRSLTVMRAMIEAGLPSSDIFAAAFGAEQPVADNAQAEGRAKNRRVEMAPTPRTARARPAAGAASVPDAASAAHG
ncbi:MAG: OmpA family protein [Burkholderiales bacterium]|nr:OmpA family protein [Burkholderiales bacterium]